MRRTEDFSILSPRQKKQEPARVKKKKREEIQDEQMRIEADERNRALETQKQNIAKKFSIGFQLTHLNNLFGYSNIFVRFMICDGNNQTEAFCTSAAEV